MNREAKNVLVGDSIISDFVRDGAVCIRGALSADELATLARGIERNRAQRSARGIVASEPDDPGEFFEDFCCWQSIPEYESILKNSALPDIAQSLMLTETVRIYHDHLLVKTAGTRQPTPWHQDQPYYNIEGRQNVSFWIPIDPVPRESTLTFFAGSHGGMWFMPRTFKTHQARWFPEGSLQELPDMSRADHQSKVIGWALQPGDCVAFHMLTLHAASGSNTLRRVFSARYIGDDIRHAPRPWKTSPAWPSLEAELPAGAAMDHPLFPRVR
jgi:ectoine hydroxylase-related dioxygenase (phytanoyl-CoA dioxygenase family)